MELVSFNDILRSSKRISPFIRNTPVVPSPKLKDLCGANRVHMKLESLQVTGAFKARGACSKITSLTIEEQKKG